jgi:hypothetical protein
MKLVQLLLMNVLAQVVVAYSYCCSIFEGCDFLQQSRLESFTVHSWEFLDHNTTISLSTELVISHDVRKGMMRHSLGSFEYRNHLHYVRKDMMRHNLGSFEHRYHLVRDLQFRFTQQKYFRIIYRDCHNSRWQLRFKLTRFKWLFDQ